MKKFSIIAIAILFSISMFVPVVSAGCVKQDCPQNTDSCLRAMQRNYDRCVEREAKNERYRAERDARAERAAERRAAQQNAGLGEDTSTSTSKNDTGRVYGD